jgi:hypothetical protein
METVFTILINSLEVKLVQGTSVYSSHAALQEQTAARHVYLNVMKLHFIAGS